ncbi:MAG: hypothetical protein ACR2RL_25465 [Gammaproteobacteria bacterium]
MTDEEFDVESSAEISLPMNLRYNQNVNSTQAMIRETSATYQTGPLPELVASAYGTAECAQRIGIGQGVHCYWSFTGTNFGFAPNTSSLGK